MSLIKDILTLDINEDIKNVIDLEDQSENEIQSEIESYILTDNLGKHLSSFINQYNSNIKETGVWISGFYGSGKSYFGKMLGFLLSDKSINGTSARERFILRLNGLKDQNFIENQIRSLDAHQTKVVFLDIAKQDTTNGLCFTLFKNFLSTLGFLPNVYGYLEYLMWLDDAHEEFKQRVLKISGSEWRIVMKDGSKVPTAMRRALVSYKYSEQEYTETLSHLNSSIKQFSPTDFRNELEKYVSKVKDEKVVFMFDEASEALGQKKFNLLELEGLSESLSNSTLSSKVWVLAIAQEKLDDVINNSNVNKSMLTKVTDRFKTKLHLESTEVDKIIRQRILQKKDDAFQNLKAYYAKNEGQLADASNLKAIFPTRVESAEEFATYYPFHKYQFKLLQNFLFSSKALASTQVAARGMIITTFDIMRRQLADVPLHQFATAFDICNQAQTAPPADLVNRYDNANQILGSSLLEGRKILEVIHFLSESDLVKATTESITKSYIRDLNDYYKVKPLIEDALQILVDAKILLITNGVYKITSDLEGKLLDDMKDFPVELFNKKRDFIEYLKKFQPLRSLGTVTDGSNSYGFNISTDLDDEIVTSSNKKLRLVVTGLFNINDEYSAYVERVKLENQSNKETIILIPDNSNFNRIDTLLTEVKRFKFMDEKYGNDPDPNVRQIVKDFNLIREEKEKELTTLIQKCYLNGISIYLFDENKLNEDTFKNLITESQKKLIRNVYTKRLSDQLSESIGPKIIIESQSEKLHKYFSGNDFKFFDTSGNFIGDHLKVTEEVTAKIKTTFADGKSLESELLLPPTGYSYGTVATTLAVLFRAGKLVAKYNGHDLFSYKDNLAGDIFATSKNFQKASFKFVSKSLTAAQKNEMVQILHDLSYKAKTGEQVDWNTNDFELVKATGKLADYYLSIIKFSIQKVEHSHQLFPGVETDKAALMQFTSLLTENNYIEKAEYFIQEAISFKTAAKSIEKTEKFIEKSLPKAHGLRRFIDMLTIELNKSGELKDTLQSQIDQFNLAYNDNLRDRFAEILDIAQGIRDNYYNLMTKANEQMTQKYGVIKGLAEDLLKTIGKYPAEPNKQNISDAKAIITYAQQRIFPSVSLEFHIACQNSHFTLSEIRSNIELASKQEDKLFMIQNNIIETSPEPPAKDNTSDPGGNVKEPPAPKLPRKVKLSIAKTRMTVKEYRNILAEQLKQLSGMDNNDEIDLTIN